MYKRGCGGCDLCAQEHSSVDDNAQRRRVPNYLQHPGVLGTRLPSNQNSACPGRQYPREAAVTEECIERQTAPGTLARRKLSALFGIETPFNGFSRLDPWFLIYAAPDLRVQHALDGTWMVGPSFYCFFPSYSDSTSYHFSVSSTNTRRTNCKCVALRCGQITWLQRICLLISLACQWSQRLVEWFCLCVCDRRSEKRDPRMCHQKATTLRVPQFPFHWVGLIIVDANPSRCGCQLGCSCPQRSSPARNEQWKSKSSPFSSGVPSGRGREN